MERQRIEQKLKTLEFSLWKIKRELQEMQKEKEQLQKTIDQLSAAPPKPRPEVVRRPPEVKSPRIKVVKVRKGGRATKFTDEVLNNIPIWLEEGLNRDQIADRIGCSPNSLQVSCSKRGISLWSKARPRNQIVEVVYEEDA
jgi:hypothetical protein